MLHMAGFEVWDVNMEDLCSEAITLDRFHGLVFVGGFSYADVLGSAKGNALIHIIEVGQTAHFDKGPVQLGSALFALHQTV